MENINFVKEQLLNHATYFLENMGEFYPIGMALFNEKKIIFHGVEDNDVKVLPTIKIMTETLSNKLFTYLEEKDALCIGMALDTDFTNKNGVVKTIEMRIISEDGKEDFTYFTYKIVNSKVIILNESSTPWTDLKLNEN